MKCAPEWATWSKSFTYSICYSGLYHRFTKIFVSYDSSYINLFLFSFSCRGTLKKICKQHLSILNILFMNRSTFFEMAFQLASVSVLGTLNLFPSQCSNTHFANFFPHYFFCFSLFFINRFNNKFGDIFEELFILIIDVASKKKKGFLKTFQKEFLIFTQFYSDPNALKTLHVSNNIIAHGIPSRRERLIEYNERLAVIFELVFRHLAERFNHASKICRVTIISLYPNVGLCEVCKDLNLK